MGIQTAIQVSISILLVCAVALIFVTSNESDEDLILSNSLLQQQLYSWQGAGEASASDEVKHFQKMGIIPKIKRFKWTKSGETTLIKEMKEYHDAFPNPEYVWNDYASKSLIKELHDSNVVHHIDSPYFEKQ